MPPKKKGNTRSSVDKFLVGPPSEKPASADKLLTNGDVLAYLNFCKCDSVEPWESYCSCPLKTGSQTIKCQIDQKCEKAHKCLVAFIHDDGGWDKTGFKLKTDYQIS